MEYLSNFWHWIGTPFRFLGHAVRSAADMTPGQIRSFYSFAMIGGMIWFSFTNLYLIAKAEKAAQDNLNWFHLLTEQIRFGSIIIICLAVIMGLVVWGATRFMLDVTKKRLEMGTDARDPLENSGRPD